jgi:hypothetical protein
MARIYAPNEDHTCDYGVDFFNGAAAVPDASTLVVAHFLHKGYVVVPGVDVLSPWDYLSGSQLALFAPYAGINPVGLSKAALVAAVEAQLALMKIEISEFTAIAPVPAGTEGEAIYANAAAVIAVLPTEVYCDAGTVPVPVTTWVDTDGYNPNATASYTFTATLGDLPVPYANTGSFTATVEVVVSDDVEITAFDEIADIAGGTVAVPVYADANAVIAALPDTVLGNTGSVAVPVTTWVNTDNYNPAVAGSYTFTATLGDIPAGYANTAAVTATVEVVITTAAITGFDEIADVDGGTIAAPTYADAAAVIAALPETADANDGTITVDVATWVDTDSYNPAVAGSYTFTATLDALPADVTNAENYTATVEVVVAAE